MRFDLTSPAALSLPQSRKGRLLSAFLLGLLMVGAMPPLGLFPLLFLCLPCLYFLLIRAESSWQAALVGGGFFFGFFLLGLYWVPVSMLTDIERYWWFIPIAQVGLPLLLTPIYMLAAVLFHLIRQHIAASNRWSDWALLSLTLFLAEWLRGWLFTGFPWLNIGHAYIDALPLIQISYWIGSEAFSLLALALALLPITVKGTRSAVICLAIILILLATNSIYGLLRLSSHTTDYVEGVTLRLIQPNVRQIDKWKPERIDQHFADLLRLSREGAEEAGITHVIWPETATANGPIRNPEDLQAIQEASGLTGLIAFDRRDYLRGAAPENGFLITGLPYYTEAGAHNGLWALDDRGQLHAHYEKHHLVPFGEYTPLRHLPAIAQLAAGAGNFVPGAGPRSLHLPNLPAFSPLICYEVIFPRKVYDRADPPQWLLNITNDGWFGHTAGPHQHLAIARLRAVETGLPLIRVANTGVSAVIDPLGRYLDRADLGEKFVLDTKLPTPYCQSCLHEKLLHEYILWGFLLTLLCIRLVAKVRLF